MKRRDFLRTVGVAAAATTLPVRGAVAGSAAAGRTYGMSAYAWAKYTARINKRLTPEMLTRLLGFSDAEASRMIRRLTFEQVLTAPDPNGVSRTSADYLGAFKKRFEGARKLADALTVADDAHAETSDGYESQTKAIQRSETVIDTPSQVSGETGGTGRKTSSR